MVAKSGIHSTARHTVATDVDTHAPRAAARQTAVAPAHVRRGIGVGALVLALLSLVPVAALRAGDLTLERLFAQPSVTGTTPSAPVWSADGARFAFTWNARAQGRRGLYVAARDGTGLRRVDAVGEAAGAVRAFAWHPDAQRLLFLFGDGLWSTAANGMPSRRLATVGEGASGLTVSPRGTQAAWLDGGDLWLADLDRASPQDTVGTRATDVGIASPSRLSIGRYNRREREIGPGIWSGPTYAWSPDGSTIAVHYVDRRDMRQVPFPDYLAPETDLNPIRRGYPGDDNELRTVGLLDVATRELRLLPLEAPTARQVLDFAWSPDGGRLLLDIADDTAVDRWLYTVERGTDARREVWHSHRESRIYTAFASAWHPDGRHLIVLSDLADRYGVYSVEVPMGALSPATSPPADPMPAESAPASLPAPTRLSDPAFDVLGAPAVVARTGQLFYAANGPAPQEQHVYRVGLHGGAPERLTYAPGSHQGFPSPDGRYLAVLYSSDTSPPEIYVTPLEQHENADAVVAPTGDGAWRRVTRSPPSPFAQHSWVPAQYVSFPSRIDDYTLHGRLLLPAGFDPGRRYPVVFGPVYSGTVRNRWRGVYSLVQQLLVQQGYIVMQVDVRGSTGYGRAFREAFLTDFAGDDIEDLASAVEYLKTLPYVDPARFGIWGSSYGGTLTVYTLLTRPGLFCAGVAAAAAVDPFFFGTDDVAIVRRPSTHPDIFQRQARRYADQLQDHLLLIHGMQDQVVPFKTTVELAEALIRAGKDFDFAFAPGATHAWSREAHYQRYLFGKLVAFFDRHLMSDDGCR
jgi:dipeptidyl-peptidase-4